jgi:signal transduction histidine kinase
VGVLKGLRGTWLRQVSPTRRVAAWVLAVAGPALFTLGALLLHSPLVLGGFLFCMLLVVIAVAVVGGTRQALACMVLTAVAREVFFVAPFQNPDAGLRPNPISLVGFIIAGATVAILIGELARLAGEQAALRRVATLVARGAPPADVFTAIADELGRLVGADATFVSSVDLPGADGPGEGADGPSAESEEPEGHMTVVGSYGRVSDEVPIGFRMRLEPGMITTTTLRTGLPARIKGESLAQGPFGSVVAKLGLRAAVATPIVVGGRRWGVTVAATSREDFPAGIESRMADFVELAATAIANAQAEQELRELANTQAALRRLATLVAQGESSEAVFAAATSEALRHFGGGTARMIRYELDGTATLLANEGTTGPHVRVGEAWEGYPPTGLTATVLRTGRAARVDDYRDLPGGEPYLREGLRTAVAVPIHVDGRLWGAIAVGAGEGRLPPDAEQRMAQFTDLVATAVANAQNRSSLEASRDELAASRTRIVAAADEARRRIERDLHDGAQQHLLALALRLRTAAMDPHECVEVRTEIADVAAGLTDVLEELREISRGIHPAILSKAGLPSAVRALGRRSAIPVDIDVRIEGRLPEPVEVGAYYVISEMLTNAAKHARASVVEVDAEASDGTLRISVRDDGVGGANPQRGSGLVGLKDRIEALGGTFSLHSPPGGGTTASCRLPVQADDGAVNPGPPRRAG